jgi:hypothetical protein
LRCTGRKKANASTGSPFLLRGLDGVACEAAAQKKKARTKRAKQKTSTDASRKRPSKCRRVLAADQSRHISGYYTRALPHIAGERQLHPGAF